MGIANKTGYTFKGWFDDKTNSADSHRVYSAGGGAFNGTYWNGSGNGALWKSTNSTLNVYAQ